MSNKCYLVKKFISRIFMVLLVFVPCNSILAMSEMEKQAVLAFQGNQTAMDSLVAGAGAGDAEAQLWLGTYNYTKKQYLKAFSFFEKSASQGNLQGIFNLARMYDKGLGVNQDLIAAKEMYLLAASAGYADAQHNVGIMYLLGDGVQKNPQEALKWLQLAAEQGHGLSQRDIGTMFADGNGVKRDLVLGYTFMSLADFNNVPNASAALAKIRRVMTAAQLERAQNMINEAMDVRKKEIQEYLKQQSKN